MDCVLLNESIVFSAIFNWSLFVRVQLTIYKSALVSKINLSLNRRRVTLCHDDVIKWKHFPRYCFFVRSPVNSPHKGQWRRDLMFSLICVWINGWVNNHEACDLKRYRTHYDVIVMLLRQLVRHACFSILQHGLTLIPARMSNYIHYKTTIEVWEWISYFIPHLKWNMITIPQKILAFINRFMAPVPVK